MLKIKTEVLMKKRILCLFLACFMLLPSFLFVGCSDDDDATADVSDDTGAITITMRMITEKKVYNSLDELVEALKKGYADDEKLDEIVKKSKEQSTKLKQLIKLKELLIENYGTDEKYDAYLEMCETCISYQAVEDEIAKKTKSDFKTNVDILFYTEDEYSRQLEADMAEYALEKENAAFAERALEKYIKEYKASSTEEYPEAAIVNSFYKYFPEYEKYRYFSSEGTASEEKYAENEMGRLELVYPEAEENQLDIVYISGYDMYMKYVENKWISPLNSFISTTGKQLTYNISSTLLNGVKVEGETYAIPNNVQIGEYTYMLVDRALAEKYKHTYESFSNIVDCSMFVNDVVTNHKDVLPINASFKDCMDMFVWYWNIDHELNDLGENLYEVNRDNEFSIVGAFYSDPAKVGRGSIELGFTNLLANKQYRDTLLCLKKYEYDGCYKAENDTRIDPAISFETGTYAMMRDAFYYENGQKKSENDPNYGVYTDENGKEYFLYVAKYPVADDDAIYGNMYAVSANTKSVQACVEVITLINTDPEVRNLLQYGIMQGEQPDGVAYNYHIDEDTGVLVRDNDLYMMDIEKTGNCFIAHPEEGLPADYWEDAKAQNNDALIDPLAGFDLNERLAEYSVQLDNDLIDYCKMISKDVYDMINDPEIDYTRLKNTLEGEYATKYSGDVSYTYTDETGASKTVTVRLTKLYNKEYDVSTGLGTPDEPEMDFNGESPYTIYYKWLTAYGYVPAK